MINIICLVVIVLYVVLLIWYCCQGANDEKVATTYLGEWTWEIDKDGKLLSSSYDPNPYDKTKKHER